MIGLAASRAWRCGERLAAAGDHEGALAALREAASLAPGDPRIRLQEALALGELGRYEEGASVARAAAADAPGNEVADLVLATVLYDAGDFDGAAAAAGRALDRVPANLQAAGLKGLARIAAGRGDADSRELVTRGLPGMSDGFRARVVAWCAAQPVPQVPDGDERDALTAELAELAAALDASAAAFGERAGFEGGHAPLAADGALSFDLAWYGAQTARFEAVRDARDELLAFHRSEPYGEDPSKIGIRPRMRAFVGMLMRAYGRHDDARAWLTRAEAEDAREYLAPYYLGVLEAEAGDATAARRHLTRALGCAPGATALEVWTETAGGDGSEGRDA